MKGTGTIARLCAAWALALALVGVAQATPQEDAKKVFDEAQKAAQVGPAEVPLAKQARLKLPEGYLFITQPHATKLLNVMGNPGDDPRLQGLIFPKDKGDWFMTVRFEGAGYVKDDDAKDWKADDLLKSYREGTEEANKEREKMGVPGLEILGWAEVPAYDRSSHRLVWAMSSREKGAPANEPQGVNYNTYVLGREGYFTMNLVTGLAELPAHKPQAQLMLSNLSFDAGKAYGDFNASTDRMAEYGLAALVVGVGAKKLGLIAVAMAFVAKFAKIIFIAVAAFGGAFMKFFKRKPKPTAE